MQEVTHLFYQMVSLNYEIQKRKEAHLKISPDAIFAMAKNQFKLLLPQNNMSPFDYNRNKLFARQPIYVSPKLYLTIQKQHFQHLKFNESKNDVFALGLCILEAGLGKSVQSIYGVDQLEDKLLIGFLREFEVKFNSNPLVSSSLKKMLEIDEEFRIDFVSLKELIPSYDQIKSYFQKLERGEVKPEVAEVPLL